MAPDPLVLLVERVHRWWRYAVTPLEPAAEGRVLVCCAKPVGEVTLEL